MRKSLSLFLVTGLLFRASLSEAGLFETMGLFENLRPEYRSAIISKMDLFLKAEVFSETADTCETSTKVQFLNEKMFEEISDRNKTEKKFEKNFVYVNAKGCLTDASFDRILEEYFNSEFRVTVAKGAGLVSSEFKDGLLCEKTAALALVSDATAFCLQVRASDSQARDRREISLVLDSSTGPQPVYFRQSLIVLQRSSRGVQFQLQVLGNAATIPALLKSAASSKLAKMQTNALAELNKRIQP